MFGIALVNNINWILLAQPNIGCFQFHDLPFGPSFRSTNECPVDNTVIPHRHSIREYNSPMGVGIKAQFSFHGRIKYFLTVHAD